MDIKVLVALTDEDAAAFLLSGKADIVIQEKRTFVTSGNVFCDVTAKNDELRERITRELGWHINGSLIASGLELPHVFAFMFTAKKALEELTELFSKGENEPTINQKLEKYIPCTMPEAVRNIADHKASIIEGLAGKDTSPELAKECFRLAKAFRDEGNQRAEQYEKLIVGVR